MNAHTITLAELATRAGVHPRTIRRGESELGLTRVPCAGRTVVYQFFSTKDALMLGIMARYRRDGSMRISHVPDPAHVRWEITRTIGPQAEIFINGCLLTLARLAEMSLYLGYEAGIQINAQRHQKLVGSRHHRRIIDALLQTRLIRKVEGYKKGKRCNSYRLTDASVSRLGKHSLWWPKLETACLKTISIHEIIQDALIPFDAAVMDRLKRDSAKFVLPPNLDMEAIAVEQAGIAVKRAKAKRKNENLSELKLEAIKRRCSIACCHARERYQADPLSVFRIGEQSQRIFHPIAMMPQRLRARLRCQGEAVTSLDIRCCQPFLLGLLLRENDEAAPIPDVEFDRYMELTRSGKFYEALGRYLVHSVCRDEIKRLSYRDIFFGKRLHHKSDIVRAFSELFPVMGRSLARLRKAVSSLASELQRREARLIFGDVLPSLQAAFPDTPITTVHDAILLPSGIAAAAKALMAQTVEEATGRRPGIKEEEAQAASPTHIC